MDVTLNMPGNFGIYNADYRTIRVVATFKESVSLSLPFTDKDLLAPNASSFELLSFPRGLCFSLFSEVPNVQVEPLRTSVLSVVWPVKAHRTVSYHPLPRPPYSFCWSIQRSQSHPSLFIFLCTHRGTVHLWWMFCRPTRWYSLEDKVHLIRRFLWLL